MEHESTLTPSILVVGVRLDLTWFSIRTQKRAKPSAEEMVCDHVPDRSLSVP